MSLIDRKLMQSKLLINLATIPRPTSSICNQKKSQESGADKRQSLYLYTDEGSYEPLARIDRTGNQEQHIYYFHIDLNGMPEELTDEAGEIVWECSYQLWGKPVQETVHREIQQNLRYQGQYLDKETGLHYNTSRYYDPDTGRFTQPDPIEFLDGINLYQYAPNGLRWIDPQGLVCANGGNGKQHGDKGHNKTIDKIIKDAEDKGTDQIRKNQHQVDSNGNKLGTNKPDIQYNYKGKHYNI